MSAFAALVAALDASDLRRANAARNHLHRAGWFIRVPAHLAARAGQGVGR